MRKSGLDVPGPEYAGVGIDLVRAAGNCRRVGKLENRGLAISTRILTRNANDKFIDVLHDCERSEPLPALAVSLGVNAVGRDHEQTAHSVSVAKDRIQSSSGPTPVVPVATPVFAIR